MSDQAFDIKTSRDFFAQLLAQYEEFRLSPTSSRLSINCALWSYHLCDWIHHEFGERVPFSDCPSLQVMRDVINGSKHLRLNYKPTVVASELHHGDFSNDFSRDFDISCLLITTFDGKDLYFEDELENVVRFWSEHPRLVKTSG